MELLYVKLDDHKWVENPEFTQAINHLIQVLKKESQANTEPPPVQSDKEFIVRNSDGETALILKDIHFLEGSGNSVAFNYKGKSSPNTMLKLVCGKNIKTYIHLLTEEGFFRCHQSYIVNLHHVILDASARCFVCMVNGKRKELPISSRFWKQHKTMLLNLPQAELQVKAA